MNLGENIYRLRTQKNMSQGDLADALEVSRQSVSKWENNSAVPELEKLVKMAQLFEVSIDVLVTGKETQQEDRIQETKVIYVEKPARASISPAQILGVLLLFCTALILGLAYLLKLRDLEDCVPLCLLLALCGVFCLVAQKPSVWCSWVVVAGYWLYIVVLSARWESQPLLLFLGVVLAAAALAYTVHLHRRGTIHVQPWVWCLLALILCSAGLLLLVNLLPPVRGTVTPVAPMPLKGFLYFPQNCNFPLVK